MTTASTQNPDVQVRRARVLHLAPSHVDYRPGQGSHKDVGGRKAFLQQHASSFRYCSLKVDRPSQLDAHVEGWTPPHILIEYSYFPKIAKALRTRFPHARMAVRAHKSSPCNTSPASE